MNHNVETPLTWQVDPLGCPTCQREIHIMSLIDESTDIEMILKHPELWAQSVTVHSRGWSGTEPPTGETVYEPWLQGPFPGRDNDPLLFAAID